MVRVDEVEDTFANGAVARHELLHQELACLAFIAR